MATGSVALPCAGDNLVLKNRRVSTIRVLRLSVTDRCNFRCRYCMPEAGVEWTPRNELLSLEGLCDQVRWLCNRTALDRVKLTGGEPLTRPGLSNLIRGLRQISQIREVSLTTNGSMLAEQAMQLKAAGLSRVNISLDSLDEDRFHTLSRGGQLSRTLRGIEAAIKVGLAPVKINAVLLRSSWRDDVPRLLDYAADVGVEVRFIELMRTGTERSWCASELVVASEVQAWLARRAGMMTIECPAATPARSMRLTWHGRPVEVGWITPRSHPFCSSCERLRMDAQGRLHRCLMESTMLDLRHVRATCNESEAIDTFVQYADDKRIPIAMDIMNTMSQMGG